MPDQPDRRSRSVVSLDIGLLPVAMATVAGEKVSAVNGAWVELMGHDPSGRSLVDLNAFEPWATVAALALRSQTAGPLDAEVTIAGGPAARVSLVRGTVGTPDTVFIVPDAAAGRSPADELLIEVDRAQELLRHGVVIGDGRHILHVSPGAAAIFGRSPSEVMGLGRVFDLFEPSEQRRMTELIENRRADGRPVPEHFETVVERPDGTQLPVELWVKAIVRGEAVRTYTLIADASERRARRDDLAHRALHDPLTGLPNRYLLLDRIDVVAKRLERHGGVAALYFVDLDGFKAINDQFGHAAGDQVLRSLAERFTGAVRDCDTVARLGGDEFVVLCSDVGDHGDGDDLKRRLRGVAGEITLGSGSTVEVGASIGSVRFADASRDPETLLAHADLSMYAEKRRGAGLS